MTTNIVNVFEPAQFGIGDGSTTQFQIGGPREVVTSIAPTGVWRQDWQGNQRLYPTPRTNLLRQSTDLTLSPWTGGPYAAFASPLITPRGDASAWAVIPAAGTNLVSGGRTNVCPKPSAAPMRITYSVIAKQAGFNNARLWLNGANTSTATAFANFSLVDGSVTQTSIGAEFSGLQYGAIALGDGWWLLYIQATTDAAANVVARLYTFQAGETVGDGVRGIAFWLPQVEVSDVVTSRIETAASAVTVTDYSASSTGLITMGQVPAIGAALTWIGSYTYEYREDAPTLADRTVISQYANSPTLRQLIQNMDEYINPDTDFDAFYSYVWNVETAQGFGLDIWGRIVGVGRMLTIPASETFLGYQEAYTAPTAATGAQPFGQAPMYVGTASSQTYRLADDAYRKLILVKALANISDCTSPSLNRLLTNLFSGRGRCYVSDTGQMEFRYVFEFALEPYEIAIMTQSGAIPKPAAVLANVLQVDVPTTFGFNEAVMQPFGSGVFFTSSGLIHASQ